VEETEACGCLARACAHTREASGIGLTQAEGILATPALRGGRRQVSNSKQPPLVEGLTGIGNVTETVSEEKATEEETQKLLIKVVSRLGLEPRALALKDQTDRF
jgi:hypothetical protein